MSKNKVVDLGEALRLRPAFVGLGMGTIQDGRLGILTLRSCVFYIIIGMVLQLAARRLAALTASVVHAPGILNITC